MLPQTSDGGSGNDEIIANKTNETSHFDDTTIGVDSSLRSESSNVIDDSGIVLNTQHNSLVESVYKENNVSVSNNNIYKNDAEIIETYGLVPLIASNSTNVSSSFLLPSSLLSSSTTTSSSSKSTVSSLPSRQPQQPQDIDPYGTVFYIRSHDKWFFYTTKKPLCIGDLQKYEESEHSVHIDLRYSYKRMAAWCLKCFCNESDTPKRSSSKRCLNYSVCEPIIQALNDAIGRIFVNKCRIQVYKILVWKHRCSYYLYSDFPTSMASHLNITQDVRQLIHDRMGDAHVELNIPEILPLPYSSGLRRVNKAVVLCNLNEIPIIPINGIIYTSFIFLERNSERWKKLRINKNMRVIEISYMSKASTIACVNLYRDGKCRYIEESDNYNWNDMLLNVQNIKYNHSSFRMINDFFQYIISKCDHNIKWTLSLPKSWLTTQKLNATASNTSIPLTTITTTTNSSISTITPQVIPSTLHKLPQVHEQQQMQYRRHKPSESKQKTDTVQQQQYLNEFMKIYNTAVNRSENSDRTSFIEHSVLQYGTFQLQHYVVLLHKFLVLKTFNVDCASVKLYLWNIYQNQIREDISIENFIKRYDNETFQCYSNVDFKTLLTYLTTLTNLNIQPNQPIDDVIFVLLRFYLKLDQNESLEEFCESFNTCKRTASPTSDSQTTSSFSSSPSPSFILATTAMTDDTADTTTKTPNFTQQCYTSRRSRCKQIQLTDRVDSSVNLNETVNNDQQNGGSGSGVDDGGGGNENDDGENDFGSAFDVEINDNDTNDVEENDYGRANRCGADSACHSIISSTTANSIDCTRIDVGHNYNNCVRNGAINSDFNCTNDSTNNVKNASGWVTAWKPTERYTLFSSAVSTISSCTTASNVSESTFFSSVSTKKRKTIQNSQLKSTFLHFKQNEAIDSSDSGNDCEYQSTSQYNLTHFIKAYVAALTFTKQRFRTERRVWYDFDAALGKHVYLVERQPELPVLCRLLKHNIASRVSTTICNDSRALHESEVWTQADFMLSTPFGVFNSLTGMYSSHIPFIRFSISRKPILLDDTVLSTPSGYATATKLDYCNVNLNILNRINNAASILKIFGSLNRIYVRAILLPAILNMGAAISPTTIYNVMERVIELTDTTSENSCEAEFSILFEYVTLKESFLNTLILIMEKYTLKQYCRYPIFENAVKATIFDGDKDLDCEGGENKGDGANESINVVVTTNKTFISTKNWSKIFQNFPPIEKSTQSMMSLRIRALIYGMMILRCSSFKPITSIFYSDDVVIPTFTTPTALFDDEKPMYNVISLKASCKCMKTNLMNALRSSFGNHLSRFENKLIMSGMKLIVSTNFKLNSFIELMNSLCNIYVSNNKNKKMYILVGPSNTGKSYITGLITKMTAYDSHTTDSIKDDTGRSTITSSNNVVIVDEVRKVDGNLLKRITGSTAIKGKIFHSQSYLPYNTSSLLLGATNNTVDFNGELTDRVTVERLHAVHVAGVQLKNQIRHNLLELVAENEYYPGINDLNEIETKEGIAWLLYAWYSTHKQSNHFPPITLDDPYVLQFQERVFRENNQVHRILHECDLIQMSDAEIDTVRFKQIIQQYINKNRATYKKSFEQFFSDFESYYGKNTECVSLSGIIERWANESINHKFKVEHCIETAITKEQLQERLKLYTDDYHDTAHKRFVFKNSEYFNISTNVYENLRFVNKNLPLSHYKTAAKLHEH